jgi:hypothetical protein
MIMTDLTEEDNLKSLASIIEYRCENMMKTKKLLEKDIDTLFHTKSKRTRDKICLDIAIKMEYIEILLSKNIDDVMSIEIIELDKSVVSLPIDVISQTKKDDGNHYFQ